jgi:hypothetical protein
MSRPTESQGVSGGQSATESKSTAFGFGPSPAEILGDPEVKRFFLGLMQSNLGPEDTYGQFVRFFELRAALSAELTQHSGALRSGNRDQADRVLAAAAHEAGLWQPREILDATLDTLKRALRRLLNSQHRDGGWGYQPEVSSTWATVYATMALHRAEELGGLAEDAATRAARRGIDWLLDHRIYWSVEDIPDTGARKIYELSAVLRSLLEIGADSSPEVRRLVAVCLQRLIEAQNADGGWDASMWGAAAHPGEIRRWSDVGATSLAVQALASTRDPVPDWFLAAIVNGKAALGRSQNPDGSWSVMLHPQSLAEAGGVPTKTCDAIKGLLAGKRLGFDITAYQQEIDRAVEWLERREKPIYTETGIAGWGWTGSELPVLEETCHTLETLLRVDRVRLPLLASNAIWLMRSQHREESSVEDGKWSNGDTGRIVLSLLEFYRVILHSPLFGAATSDAKR